MRELWTFSLISMGAIPILVTMDALTQPEEFARRNGEKALNLAAKNASNLLSAMSLAMSLCPLQWASLSPDASKEDN